MQFYLLLTIFGCPYVLWGIRAMTDSVRSERFLPRERHEPESNPSAPPELDAYELAILAGGPSRVVETAVVALVRAGVLRITRSDDLHAVAGAATPAAAVERALLAAVRARPGGLNADRAVQIVAAGPEMTALRRRVEGMGLLHRPGGSGSVRVKLVRLLAVSVLTVVVAAAGAFGFLITSWQLMGAGALAWALTGVFGLVCYMRERRGLRNVPTWSGRQEVQRVRAQYPYQYGRARLYSNPWDAAIQVALRGLEETVSQLAAYELGRFAARLIEPDASQNTDATSGSGAGASDSPRGDSGGHAGGGYSSGGYSSGSGSDADASGGGGGGGD